MSASIGGPAFPNVPEGAGTRWDDWDKGMSLRQYIAIKAMHALILNPSPDLLNGPSWDHIIAGAYQAADKMLAADAAETRDAKGGK